MKNPCPHFDPKKTLFNARLTDLSNQSPSPNERVIVRNGYYRRRSDCKKIDRFFCRVCKRYFSRASYSPSYQQKKRRLNPVIDKLLASGVSQRQAARILRINRKTVVRKFRFIAEQRKLEHASWLKTMSEKPLLEVQFDDMETSEHSKCKPLSIALAVDPSTRKILSFKVSQMPAKGRLTHIAKKKYGPRKDERGKGWRALMSDLKSVVAPNALFVSDENPHYSRFVKKDFKEATHKTYKGRRACVAGQGELKKGGFDPLFALNHTAAMLRAHLNRLFRRTWCTTKKRGELERHIWLYVHHHNHVLT